MGNSNQIKDQKIWSLEKNIEVFLSAAKKLQSRLKEKGGVEWDKDDVDAMDFVTAASNLRCHIFHIPMQSRFDSKGSLFSCSSPSPLFILFLLLFLFYYQFWLLFNYFIL